MFHFALAPIPAQAPTASHHRGSSLASSRRTSTSMMPQARKSGTVVVSRCAAPRYSAQVAVASAASSWPVRPAPSIRPIVAVITMRPAIASAGMTRSAASELPNSARAARAESDRDRESSRSAAMERARIARELHDVVAHHVSLMAVQAEAASSLLPDRPGEARRSVEIIGDTARQALAELRRLLGVLRSPAEQLDTEPSPSLGELSAVLEKVRCAGLPVDFRLEGTPYPLAPGIDVTAYRIVQEALTNTMRHAPDACADVTLRYEPGYITVSVSDSGSPDDGAASAGARQENGARPGTAPRLGLGGFGLAGIAERVASCGGSLTTGPTGAGGFAVTARLPAR
jgi:signal transduction histidine kinase